MARKNQLVPDLQLDLGRYEIRRSGRRVRLEKKPMELLIFLVARRDQLVPREDLVKKLWGSDLLVDTERNLNNVVRKLRAALGDDSDNPRFLETVVGKGYRFVGPIQVTGAQAVHSSYSSQTPEQRGNAMDASWVNRPSVAVLPLAPAENFADDRGLCLGFADALIARLGNLQGVNVLPVSAVLALPLESSGAEVAARLNTRFVVRGALQVTKGQLRLAIEMFDARLRAACFERKCDLDLHQLFELQDEIARQIAATLNRHLGPASAQGQSRYSREPMAYAEFMLGYRLSSSGDSALLEESAEHLGHAVARDPSFALAHATLSVVCATRHYEFDPARTLLEKAEFHCRRALELDQQLAEAHVANAFLLWGPSKNYQHLDAIEELRCALKLQQNLPHAYNRLGTILAHIGLLDHARGMYLKGSSFHPQKSVSHSILQVHIWNHEYDAARARIAEWRAENPGNKYPIYFAPQLAMMAGNWKEAKTLLEEAARALPDEPLIASLQGVYHAQMGRTEAALKYLNRACSNAKSFGHSHHTYYQVACILAVLGRSEVAFEWLERSVSTGFACWPFFLRDACLKNLRGLPEFDMLVSSLQAKYPDHLGFI